MLLDCDSRCSGGCEELEDKNDKIIPWKKSTIPMPLFSDFQAHFSIEKWWKIVLFSQHRNQKRNVPHGEKRSRSVMRPGETQRIPAQRFLQLLGLGLVHFFQDRAAGSPLWKIKTSKKKRSENWKKNQLFSSLLLLLIFSPTVWTQEVLVQCALTNPWIFFPTGGAVIWFNNMARWIPVVFLLLFNT